MAGFGKQVSKHTYVCIILVSWGRAKEPNERSVSLQAFQLHLLSCINYQHLCAFAKQLFLLAKGLVGHLISEKPLWYHTCGLPQMGNHNSASVLGSDDVAQFVCGSLLVTPVSPSESCRVVGRMTWPCSEWNPKKKKKKNNNNNRSLIWNRVSLCPILKERPRNNKPWLNEYFETPAVLHQAAGQDVHAQRSSQCVYRGCDAGRLASHLAKHCGWEPRNPGRFDRYTSAIPSLGIVAMYLWDWLHASNIWHEIVCVCASANLYLGKIDEIAIQVWPRHCSNPASWLQPRSTQSWMYPIDEWNHGRNPSHLSWKSDQREDDSARSQINAAGLGIVHWAQEKLWHVKKNSQCIHTFNILYTCICVCACAIKTVCAYICIIVFIYVHMYIHISYRHTIIKCP